MTTLRIILDEMLSDQPGGTARYAAELARALVDTAPAGCEVAGIVASSPQADYERIAIELPGLSDLFKSALTKRQLMAAWQHGFTRMPGGMVHAPSLLAPLGAHDRVNARGNQIAVTVHDVDAWTRQESMSPRQVAWTRSMVQRAYKYADAVVVPTHAVAAELEEIVSFRDRVRVIGGAVSPRLQLPEDADARAERLMLPARYLLATTGAGASHGLASLLTAIGLGGGVSLPLCVVGADDGLAALAEGAGLSEGRVIPLGHLSDPDLAVVMSRATALVLPAATDGFGMQLLEAFSLGTPVIHADSPSLDEVAGGAGIAVSTEPDSDYPARLAEAIVSVAEDADLARRPRGPWARQGRNVQLASVRRTGLAASRRSLMASAPPIQAAGE